MMNIITKRNNVKMQSAVIMAILALLLNVLTVTLKAIANALISDIPSVEYFF